MQQMKTWKWKQRKGHVKKNEIKLERKKISEVLQLMWVNGRKEKRELRAYENENKEITNKLDKNKNKKYIDLIGIHYRFKHVKYRELVEEEYKKHAIEIK